MSTARQIAANRSNAARSTGPRTEAGKRITRDNAMKHALSSRHIVLEDESSSDYEQLRAALTSDYQPSSSIEALLVDQIAQQSWRLSRCRTVETATYNAYRIPYRAPSDTTEAYVSDNQDERLASTFHNHIAEFDISVATKPPSSAPTTEPSNSSRPSRRSGAKSSQQLHQN
jgi:hypothetical protein